jgi:hypothetical protein
MCMVRGWANRASGAGDTERQCVKGACGSVQAGERGGRAGQCVGCRMWGAERYMCTVMGGGGR